MVGFGGTTARRTLAVVPIYSEVNRLGTPYLPCDGVLTSHGIMAAETRSCRIRGGSPRTLPRNRS